MRALPLAPRPASAVLDNFSTLSAGHPTTSLELGPVPLGFGLSLALDGARGKAKDEAATRKERVHTEAGIPPGCSRYFMPDVLRCETEGQMTMEFAQELMVRCQNWDSSPEPRACSLCPPSSAMAWPELPALLMSALGSN